MKNKRLSGLILFCWMLVMAWGVSSCSRGPEAKPKAASQVQKDVDQRTKWRMDTLVGEYERVGTKNPKWDADAKTALESFAAYAVEEADEAEADWRRTARYSADAVANGCNDPLVRYLYLREAYDSSQHSGEEKIKAYVAMADSLAASGYCEIRKFWASEQAALHIHAIQKDNRDYHRLRKDSISHLAAALEDKSMPSDEATVACRALLEITSNNKKTFPEAYQAIEAPLFRNFGNTYVPYEIKGRFNIDMAWRSRGSGTIDTVTEEGMKGFEKYLAVADEALKQGWKIDPTSSGIATEMMTVELGQGKGRDTMELWFQRAMKTNPRNRAACLKKLNYLQPKWYGSIEAMREFGWQCATNKAYQGTTTLMLVDVHKTIAEDSDRGSAYWKIPVVWEDIHAAYENFFERNPDADRSHYTYIRYANACGHPEVVAEQISLLKEPINYLYFGGKEAFETMKKQVMEAAKK